MGDILSGSLIIFMGWLTCVTADKYYKFKVSAYYWFIGAASGVFGGLVFSGAI